MILTRSKTLSSLSLLNDDLIRNIASNLLSIPLHGAFGIVHLSRCCKALHALLHEEFVTKAEDALQQAWKCSFEWRIPTKGIFSDEEEDADHKIHSPTFATPLGHNFRILLFPNGNKVRELSVYLVIADAETLPQGWSRQVEFCITVVNHIDSRKNVVKEAEHTFTLGDANDWGFRHTVSLHDVRDPRCGFLAEDNLVVSTCLRVIPQFSKFHDGEHTTVQVA